MTWTARLERRQVTEGQGGYSIGDLVEVHLGAHATLHSACIQAITTWKAAPHHPHEVELAVLIATAGDLEGRLGMANLVAGALPSWWRTRWSFRIV